MSSGEHGYLPLVSSGHVASTGSVTSQPCSRSQG